MCVYRWNAASSRRARTGAGLLAAVALIATTAGAYAAPPTATPAKAHGRIVSMSSDMSEFGARKRVRRGGSAAGLAMMGMTIGAIGGMIAAERRREAAEEAYIRSQAYYPYGYPGYHHPHPYYGSRGYYRGW